MNLYNHDSSNVLEFIDTHCHLTFEPLIDQLDDVLARAVVAGVGSCITAAFDHQSWEQIVELTIIDSIYGALGVHPWCAHEELDYKRLKQLLRHEKIVAVGEIGLDYKRGSSDKQRQQDLLRHQLDIAQDLDLPVILHCVGAFEDLYHILDKDYNPPIRGVLHGFSRSLELGRRFTDLGLYLGLGGLITRNKARKIRRTASEVPLKMLLLETDAPSGGLALIPPGKNEPCHIAEIAWELAKLREQPLQQIAEETTQNARVLFGIS